MVDEAEIRTTKIVAIKEEKAQPEDEEGANKNRDTTNPKYNDTIVKGLGIMLLSVEL